MAGAGRLRPWHVAAALGWYLAADTIVWTTGGAVAVARAGPGAGEGAVAVELLRLTPVLLPASAAAGALAVLLTLWSWARRLGEPTFGSVVTPYRGSGRQLAAACAAGATAAALFLGFIGVMPDEAVRPPSLLVQAASTPGATRWAWAFAALVLAPPTEEALFRGAVLGGLAHSWGMPAAAVVSGAVFWLLHAPEWLRYWPAGLGIALLTVVVTVARVRSRALGSCVAAHFGYNLVLALTTLGVGAGVSP